MIDLQQEFDALFDDPTCLRPVAAQVDAVLNRVLLLAPNARALLTKTATEDLRKTIWQRLLMVFCPSLVAGLQDHMGQGEFLECVILADHPSSELKDAVRRFGLEFDEAKLARLYEREPLLPGFVERISQNCVDFLSEFLRHFASKRGEISARLFGGQDLGQITSLFSLSYRQRGRAVIRVRCGTKCFYYKPRDCRIDAFYRELVDALFSDVMVAPDVVLGDGYGFCSELVGAPLQSKAHVGRYFYNYGAVAALFVTLNGVDLHKQNVIACGIYPGVIDQETLLAPILVSVESALWTQAERVEQASIAYLAILPNRTYLPGRQSSTLHYDASVENPNLPVCDGEVFGVEGHEEHFVAGFCDAYRRIAAARDKILALLSGCRSMTVRSLYNVSAFYDVILARLMLPDSLASVQRQEEHLAHLAIAQPARGMDLHESITSYEWQSLLAGDSPCFCVDVFGTALCGNDISDVLVKDGLEETPFDRAKGRLASLSEEELAMEVKLIRNGFAHALHDSSRSFDEPLREQAFPLSKKDLTRELLKLLRKLHADSIEAPDHTLFWRSANLSYTGRRRCDFATLHADVLSLAGAVLCTQAKGAVREEAASLFDQCIGALATKLNLWAHAEALPTMPPGLMNGLGGILCGCMFAKRAGLSAGRELTDGMVAFVCNNMPCELDKLGLREGVAGLLFVLCALSPEDTHASMWRDTVGLLAEQLVATLEDEQRKGELLSSTDPFAGAAGVGTALAAAQAVLGGERYSACIQEAFGAVSNSWQERICGWYRRGRGIGFKKGAYAAGIGLCAAYASDRVADADGSIARCLELALRSEMNEQMLYRRDVLDNGNALRVLFLNAVERCRPNMGYGARARAILSQMIARKREVGDFVVSEEGLTNSFDASLLVGTTGIGLAIIDCMPL